MLIGFEKFEWNYGRVYKKQFIKEFTGNNSKNKDL